MTLAVVREIKPLNLFQVKRVKQNNIIGILESRGLTNVTPSESLLKELGVNRTRFGRILRNETALTGSEIILFAKWLGVSEIDLIDESNSTGKKTQ